MRLVAADAASFCVAGVALGDMNLVCVAGVALGDTNLHFVWQAWHLRPSAGSSDALGRRGCRIILCGRLGTWRHEPPLCVAGVALSHTKLDFVWQAWHLRGSAGSGDALGRRGRRGILCGRRGTWRHEPPLCVAGVALSDMDLHFVWQAWHLRHWAGSGDALGRRGRRVILCGRRGTWRHEPPLCVAGVALGDMDLHFVWQAWHLRRSAGSGVALGDMNLHFVWQAWHLVTCGRRGPYGTGLGLVTRLVAADAASFCVAGMALGDMKLHFVGQAWHLLTWTFVLCGRRDTYGTGLGLVTSLVAADAASFCVAGVALGDMNLHFVGQAWHLVTWTFVLCGRRGTYGTGLGLATCLVAADAASICVAGVALGDMNLHFVWQAWLGLVKRLVAAVILCGRRGLAT
eukprot:s95_g17.t1